MWKSDFNRRTVLDKSNYLHLTFFFPREKFCFVFSETTFHDLRQGFSRNFKRSLGIRIYIHLSVHNLHVSWHFFFYIKKGKEAEQEQTPQNLCTCSSSTQLLNNDTNILIHSAHYFCCLKVCLLSLPLFLLRTLNTHTNLKVYTHVYVCKQVQKLG